MSRPRPEATRIRGAADQRRGSDAMTQSGEHTCHTATTGHWPRPHSDRSPTTSRASSTASTNFNDPRQEWRRIFSEVLGTFFLVLVAAGGGMMGHAFPGVISRTAAVVAPALMVHGHHLVHGQDLRRAPQPGGVSIAFALRRDFPWRRVPGYIVAQLAGATLAALFLHAVINVSAIVRVQLPRPRVLRHGRVLDGADPDHGPGQRDPGHGVGRPERRHHRRLRGRRLHRSGRACGAAPSRAPR